MPQIPSGMSMMLKSLGFDADQFAEQLKGFQAGVMEKMTAAESAMKSADAKMDSVRVDQEIEMRSRIAQFNRFQDDMQSLGSKMDDLGKRMLVIELALSSITQKIHAENPIELENVVQGLEIQNNNQFQS